MDSWAWVKSSGGLQFHPFNGPDAGGTMVDPSPVAGEYLIAGDWDGNGTDTVAWVKSAGGLQIHSSDGPYNGGTIIDPNPVAGEYLIAGDWNGDGKDTVAWVKSAGGLQYHPSDGPDVGGTVIDPSPAADETLISGNWTGTAGGGSCTDSNSCTPESFASALLGYSTVGAPNTPANIYALTKWEKAEGGGAGCPGQPPRTAPWSNSPGPSGNPLNTTRREPGSTDWNSVPVEAYHDGNGHTCWYWGLKADGDALLNGHYPSVLAVLRDPSTSNSTQCARLSAAVATSPWGTPSFSGLCNS